MSDELRDTMAAEGPHDRGQLERHFITEYLLGQGVDPHQLHKPSQEERTLLKEAARYASAKLMEIEVEARFVHQFHEAGGSGHSSTGA